MQHAAVLNRRLPDCSILCFNWPSQRELLPVGCRGNNGPCVCVAALLGGRERKGEEGEREET